MRKYKKLNLFQKIMLRWFGVFVSKVQRNINQLDNTGRRMMIVGDDTDFGCGEQRDNGEDVVWFNNTPSYYEGDEKKKIWFIITSSKENDG